MIALDRLSRRFGDRTAVDAVSFEIAPGEFFGLLGPNGAGKSTILLMLSTLLPPSGGGARINGLDIARQPRQVRASIGIVFQDPSSDDVLSAYENLKLHGMLYGLPAELRERRIREVLSLVDLTDR
ncbi:MAG TPA: ATP-binding cassette domain-containing protein, partial [Gemmatimonadales bacterium]|nr:ATP-binding cassette domain-containing protein [Gemmatimonadales bacterium]